MTNFTSDVPETRVRSLNRNTPRPHRAYVLYWMTAYRRVESNFALQRAADWARSLQLPLVVFSALRLDYRWATARTHAFILDGIADVDRALDGTAAVHFTFVETAPGAGKGLLAALADNAAVVVADDAPVFFLPAMTAKAARDLPVLVEGVDHNGMLPLAVTDRNFLRAYDFRRYLQRELPAHLEARPDADPLRGLVPAASGLLDDVAAKWTSLPPSRSVISALPVDRSVPAVEQRGGETAARDRLNEFVADRLGRYEQRNHPDEDAASGLSPYFHFGHVSPHQVFDAVAEAEGWSPHRLGDGADGRRSGWWGMSAAAESFLDQSVTWRELGYHAARHQPHNAEYAALPAWAQQTLQDHAADPREYLYSTEQLAAAGTHDELWNAAQRQLRDQGTIHNYLRMLWGKKILEWSRTPQIAHDVMFELNNLYALDGRDPNSVTGIHWVLGRYDRPWGPERPVFGKVRYMSSDSTRRKLRIKRYLAVGQALF
ncbi:MAG: deoxyribodipyrimidine photolyase [Acidimicrobiia bacterium]|nr:deoxyribodipyrimidine photolyase [Acidimicrobiia bacterium]